jgi:DNA-binding LytR/AlgR family response regulator
VVKKSELIYVKSDRDYLEYHLTNRLIVAIGTLRKEEERLKEKGFLRVHHSYLINLSAMKHFTPKCINMGEVEIPIGRAYKAAVLKQIEEQG